MPTRPGEGEEHWVRIRRSTLLMLESMARGGAALFGFADGVQDHAADPREYVEIKLPDGVIERLILMLLERRTQER